MEERCGHARDQGHAQVPRAEPVRPLRPLVLHRLLLLLIFFPHLSRSDDYHTYNKICGQVRRLSHLLSRLPPADPFRTKYEDVLLSKLYDMGILDRGAKMSDIEGSDAPVVKGFKGKEKEVEGQGKKEGKVTVGAVCRRRLAVVMVRLKMAETVKMVSRYSLSTPRLCTADEQLRAVGRHLHRAGSRPRRARHDHRPGLPRHAQHGGLCHLGRHVQAQASHPVLQRASLLPLPSCRALAYALPSRRTSWTTSTSWPRVFDLVLSLSLSGCPLDCCNAYRHRICLLISLFTRTTQRKTFEERGRECTTNAQATRT